MNDLATRLRALADRIDAIDTSHLSPELNELSDEMIRQRIALVEQGVWVLFGNPDRPAPRGVVQVLKEAIEAMP